ncbi:MAG: hypothetical protein ACRENS_07310 [Candidatus Eiseniibacteriota bacterium]
MSCSRTAAPQAVRIGHHNVSLSPPRGWEHLDHGREQLFRNGETELALEDFGPIAPDGLANEVSAAHALWLSGRRLDAFARVRQLHGLPLELLSSEARAEFWRPWYDATYDVARADSAEIGVAFENLTRSARALPEVPHDRLVERLMAETPMGPRSEVAHWDSLVIHGASWLSIETWSRVSHMGRERLACLDNGGYLLLLTTQRGPIEQTGSAFDSLLASIEVLGPR